MKVFNFKSKIEFVFKDRENTRKKTKGSGNLTEVGTPDNLIINDSHKPFFFQLILISSITSQCKIQRGKKRL